MIVYINDVKKLIDDCIKKYQEEYHVVFGEPSMQEFFEEMIDKINFELNSKLNYDTFYKQYYLKSKTHESSEIGYSINYLNTLSSFAYQEDYLDKFEKIDEDKDEIPEFPIEHPCFPSTPAINIEFVYNGKKYTNIWIKDEHHNPTGTHKDRKAHELYLEYNDKIRALAQNNKYISLQRASIISSGYAALALQYRLYKAGLFNLKVIIDKNTDQDIVNLLYKSKAEVYKEDLSVRLTSEQILEKTENKNGIDLTYAIEIHERNIKYYDWLSYECLNLNPNYLFIPFGSGELFKNILEVHAKEIKSRYVSKRYFGNKEILGNCNFIGVRPKLNNRKSRFKCLISLHDSSKPKDNKPLYKYCGSLTDIYKVDENNERIEKALNICSENKIITEESGIAGLVYFLQMIDEGKEFVEKDKVLIINTGTIKSYLFE